MPISRLKEVTLIPVSFRPVRSVKKGFDLAKKLLTELARNQVALRDGDILVLSSKFAALSEGRLVRLETVKVGNCARALSRQYDIDSRLAQLVLQESESILGGVPGYLLTISKGILAPNAGIDRSNVAPGWVILYSEDLGGTANKLRERVLRMSNAETKSASIRRLGIIISDSRISATRTGTTGIALAVAGFEPLEDLRGKRDLFGNELKVTLRALADQLASGAQYVMGESSEAVPLCLIRGTTVQFTSNPVDSQIMNIPQNRCLIIQGLRNPPSIRCLAKRRTET